MISEVIIIGGSTYNVPVISIKRKGEFLDRFAERTADGVLHRDLIGVYYNYQLQLGTTTDTEEYRRLWRKLTEPEEFHTVTIPDADGAPFTFSAYFSNVSDELYKIKDAKNYWRGLTVNFIARRPART